MKTIKKTLLTFILLILIGWGCNIAAALIPNSLVHNNILESIETFKTEGPFKPVIGTKYMNSLADNNTDAWMLLMADYNGPENILKKSMAGYYQAYENTSQTGSWAFDLLVSSADTDAKASTTFTYSRYWHGWMLPLKLLLIFCSYEDIRYIGMALIFVFLFGCLYMMIQNHLKLYAIAFGMSILFMLPLTAMISFEYSFILYITLVSNIILIRYHYKIKNLIGFSCFFMILGMITSYFDFLTYPPVTLGYCFMTLLFINLKDSQYTFRYAIRDLIKYAVAWACGYAGMWISKWIIGTAVLQTNVIQDAINQLMLRTSQTDGISEISEHSITYIQALKNNLEVFSTRGYLFIGLLFTLLFVYLMIKNNCFKKDPKTTKRIASFFPIFALIGIIPFAWVFVLKNHTYLHRNFTSNLFSLSFLAFFAFLSYILEYSKTNHKN